MLQEFSEVRQIAGEQRRRWFSDDYFDLIIWLEKGGAIRGFQLCYDKERKPRAFTWTRGKGDEHHAIDDGDTAPGGHKSSPVLVPDGLLDRRSVAERFKKAAATLPPDIRKAVLSRLAASGKSK